MNRVWTGERRTAPAARQAEPRGGGPGRGDRHSVRRSPLSIPRGAVKNSRGGARFSPAGQRAGAERRCATSPLQSPLLLQAGLPLKRRLRQSLGSARTRPCRSVGPGVAGWIQAGNSGAHFQPFQRQHFSKEYNVVNTLIRRPSGQELLPEFAVGNGKIAAVAYRRGGPSSRPPGGRRSAGCPRASWPRSRPRSEPGASCSSPNGHARAPPRPGPTRASLPKSRCASAASGPCRPGGSGTAPRTARRSGAARPSRPTCPRSRW